MALWQPSDGAIQPIVWARAASAVWSGSNLSSLANLGSIGGSFTVVGTPTKGTAINGVDPIYIGSNGVSLDITIPAFGNSGTLFVFAVLAVDATSQFSCLLASDNWNTASGSVFVECSVETGSGAPFACGDGFGGGPAIEGDNFIADTGLNIFSTRLGSAGNQRVYNAVDITSGLSYNASGTVPAYTDLTLGIGSNGANLGYNQPVKARLLHVLVYNQDPGDTLREELEGWSLWEASEEGKLPSGHPYELAAPETSGPVGTGAYTEADDTIAVTATHPVIGTGAYTEAADTIGASTALPTSGVAAWTESDDTVSGLPVLPDGYGFVTDPDTGDYLIDPSTGDYLIAVLDVEGGLGVGAWTEADDTIASTSVVKVAGVGAWTEAADTVSTGSISTVQAVGAYTEADDTASAAVGQIIAHGIGEYTEASDSLTATGSIFTPYVFDPNMVKVIVGRGSGVFLTGHDAR